MPALVVLSFVPDDISKSFHPVLAGRNVFMLRDVSENFRDHRN
jgi:hypothetical protein